MRLAQSVPTTLFFIHLEVIMQFPRSEAEIAKLTVSVAQGLEDAAQDFPAPLTPFLPERQNPAQSLRHG